MCPATDPDGSHAGSERRKNVVVDTIADVEDLVRGSFCLLDNPCEKPGTRLLHSPALGRADEVDMRAEESFVMGVHVSRSTETEPLLAQGAEARQRVRVKVAVCEHERRRALRLPPSVGRRLVDERLADVEDDDPHSHPITVSRSASDVTLSSRGSPSTDRKSVV